MPRCTIDDVRANMEASPGVNLQPFIEAASALVDHVESKDSNSLLNDTLLKQIEIRVACHYCSRRDQQLVSESVGGASGQYMVGQLGEGLRATTWGQDAIQLDITGVLATLGESQVPFDWLGKSVPERVDYEDRN